MVPATPGSSLVEYSVTAPSIQHHTPAILPATEASLRRAAEVLAAGGLVGLPTETVYGLAANAWDTAAVSRIFAAKGRPASNPLIVHVAEVGRIAEALQWPPTAVIGDQLERLVDLWPGPLTLVGPRGPRVSDLVTAGRATVAVRIPAHDVARRLLDLCPFPLAAPSANRSCYISPTRAEHVCDASGLAAHVSLVLDGGPAVHGVESTILLLGERPRLLRPGSITADVLAERLGISVGDLVMASEPAIKTAPSVGAVADTAGLLAPGMMKEHYAPVTPLVLLDHSSRLASASHERPEPAGPLGRIAFEPLNADQAAGYQTVETLSQSGDLVEVAHHLFAALRRLDRLGLAAIHCDSCPPIGLGQAIMDRLRRAAARWERP